MDNLVPEENAIEINSHLHIVAEDQFTITGMAVPYNQLGFPEVISNKETSNETKALGFIFLPGSTLTANGEQKFWEDKFDMVITHNPPESIVPLAGKNDFMFTDTPQGVKFTAKLDPNDPVAVEIHTALKEKRIEGNVSVKAKIVDATQGEIMMSAGSKVVSVDVCYIKDAYLEHLAFLGNIQPAFADAMGIAAKEDQEYINILNSRISAVAQTLLQKIGITSIGKENDEEKESEKLDVHSSQGVEAEILDPLRIAAAVRTQNEINYYRGKSPLKLKEGNHATN